MFKSIIRKIILRLETWCEKNNRTFLIRDRDKDGKENEEIYLVRNIVFKSKWFNFYIHRFLTSDDETHHDHPWHFISHIVEGGYKEERLFKVADYYKRPTAMFTKEIGERKAGSWAHRRPSDIHRVIIDKKYTFEQRKTAPLTFILFGVRKREWGFWQPIKEGSETRRFIPWKEFLGMDESHPDFAGHE